MSKLPIKQNDLKFLKHNAHNCMILAVRNGNIRVFKSLLNYKYTDIQYNLNYNDDDLIKTAAKLAYSENDPIKKEEYRIILFALCDEYINLKLKLPDDEYINKQLFLANYEDNAVKEITKQFNNINNNSKKSIEKNYGGKDFEKFNSNQNVKNLISKFEKKNSNNKSQLKY